jgi:peptide/nickel transport system substrate-binding protein
VVKRCFLRFLFPFLLLLLLLVPSFMSCGDQAPSSLGGTLRVTYTQDGNSIGLPGKATNTTVTTQSRPAIETLFRVDKTGNVTPWLATDYKNDTAAKTITMSLRKGVKFHDGTDFNAAAVKWNLDQAMALKLAGTQTFKSVDVVDDYTIRISLTAWDSTIISNFTAIPGMIVSPAAYKKNGEEWAMKNPVGTGPFTFVSWDRDVKTTFKKYPDYWQKGKPYVDAVEWIPINNVTTRMMSFKSGDIDVVPTLDPKDLADLEKAGYLINKATASNVVSLVLDSANNDSPFSKLKVRQAAQHAIDQTAIIKAILYGQGTPTNQYINKGHWAYNDSVVGYPYDPNKAKQLLAEAGYPSGFKTKLTFRITGNDDMWTAAQGMLKAVGIDVELDAVQSGRYDQLAVLGGKWEGMIRSYQSRNVDVAAPLAQMYAGKGQYFKYMLYPEDYVKAIDSAIAATDFSAKQKAMQEAMKLMSDKYCLQTILYAPYGLAVSQTTVHDHSFATTADSFAWTPESVWIDKKK